MRARCARCARPLPACLCSLIGARIAHRIGLHILQHPDEAGHPKGTAPLLQLGLTEVQLECGLEFAPRSGVLLYPGEPSSLAATPQRLILLDASWRGSRALLRANPWLTELPRLTLPEMPGRYAIRRAHRAGQLSSLEAAAHALGQLEGDTARFAPLLSALDAFVAREQARAGR